MLDQQEYASEGKKLCNFTGTRIVAMVIFIRCIRTNSGAASLCFHASGLKCGRKDNKTESE